MSIGILNGITINSNWMQSYETFRKSGIIENQIASVKMNK